MRELLNLPWALTLVAVISHHLALAIPAGPVGGTGGTATIVQPGSGSANGSVAYALPNGPALNITNAFSGIGAVSSGFPPGPCPPEDVTFYEVPHSNPVVTLKFQNFDTSRTRPPWRPQPGRDESTVRELLARVVSDYSTPADINKAMTDDAYNYEAEAGGGQWVYVLMFPTGPEPGDEDHVLRQGNWVDTLRGLQDFLAAYPGLALRFETYVTYPDDPSMESFAAKGTLAMEYLAKGNADVTS